MSLCASSKSYFNIVLLLFYSTALCHMFKMYMDLCHKIHFRLTK